MGDLLIRAFGGVAEETADGLVIDGDPARLRAAVVDGGLDHRIAMTAAVLALGARGRSTISGMEVAAVSFPGFARTLEALGAAARER
jgi:3-phosphoshikimate 1-carboxyvinyltransferase